MEHNQHKAVAVFSRSLADELSPFGPGNLIGGSMITRYCLVACLICLAGVFLDPLPAEAAAPACDGAEIALTTDYQFFLGSARFLGAGGTESGSTFRWLTNGAPQSSGAVMEDLLLHFDDAVAGANGETPSTALNMAYGTGKWGSALSLPSNGRLQYAVTNNLHLNEGTIELWVALRADGTNQVYKSQDHTLFYCRAPNGDYMQVAQSRSSGILYAGGTVSNQWESAYGDRGNMLAWKAGEWHHLAFTYSASGNFMRFYVDGALAAQNNEGHYWPPAAGASVFAVGGSTSGNTANYLLDEVRISGRVADAVELAARTRRTTAPKPNEIWLAVSNVPTGRQLVFEFTPATASQTGAVCQSASLAWQGIPITNAVPPSTLLPTGTTSLALLVETATNTSCAYAIGHPLPFAQMSPFASGAGARQHRVTVIGLNPDPAVVNDVYVRCAANPDYLVHLQYRAIAECNPPFPRKGNLWGWGAWIGKGLPYMAKVDLWLGASPQPDQVLTLRRLNPHLRVLTSINAVENGSVPEDYYLKDVNGNKIEVWPGSFRLNLTKPYVADYQARYAYQTVLDTGLMADGVFFDNVMTTQSWQNHDIYGNPVQLDADGDGVADDPAVLDAAWKAGVFRELQTFRQLMPNAIVCGHSMDINEPGISALFNGLSIGFWTSDVLEGRLGFTTLLTRYNDWLSRAVSPTTTMIESSPMAQISYGYDYSPEQHIPASTLEFARTYYPYVRFGLGLTLLNDGYFAHEFGDTWHGNDWWYDELDYNLGYPLGPAQRVDLGIPGGTNLVVNSGFESAIASPWSFWAASGCTLVITRQTTNAAAGSACARLDVSQTDGADWHIEFTQYNRSLVQSNTYDLTFWARASAPRFIAVSSQKGSPDWRNYGLDQRLAITSDWQPYTATFTANETVSDARLQFFLGETNGTVWLDDVVLKQSPPQVYRRDFNRGAVLLNASRQSLDVTVGSGFHRLTGTQASMCEMILDDQGAGFATTGAWTNRTYDSGKWTASGPFYHSWAGSLHDSLSAGSEALWQLPLEAADTYTISAWWPAAPQASNWTSQATFEVITNGIVVASTNLDQRSGGDQWHDFAVVPLSATNAVQVRLTAATGICVADALWIRSQSRYNNGQPASAVRLQPMDAIVLQRDQPVISRPRLGATSVSSDQIALSATNLTPGFTCTLERSAASTAGWQPIQSFSPLGFSTNLQDTLPSGGGGAFYRLRTY